MLFLDSAAGSVDHIKTRSGYISNDMFCSQYYIAVAETKLLATGPYENHKGEYALVGRVDPDPTETIPYHWDWLNEIRSSSGSDFVSMVSFMLSKTKLGFYGVFTRNDDREMILSKIHRNTGAIEWATNIDIQSFLGMDNPYDYQIIGHIFTTSRYYIAG